MKEDGGPAYPVTLTEFVEDRILNSITEKERKYSGMSLRDYFAGQALAGWIANPEEVSSNKRETIPAMGARMSYLYADAMLAERVKP